MILSECYFAEDELTYAQIKKRDFTADIILRLHTPVDSGDRLMYQLLDSVLEAIFKVEENIPMALLSINIKEPKYLRFTESMRLDTVINFSGTLTVDV